jgi:hypothetical protein
VSANPASTVVFPMPLDLVRPFLEGSADRRPQTAGQLQLDTAQNGGALPAAKTEQSKDAGSG